MAIVQSELILIGYWANAGEGAWPEPAAFVDSAWDVDERDEIVDYLQRGFVVRAYVGYAPCRICGVDNGTLELSDGTFVWPDGLAHYLVEHAVRLPNRFVTHALSMIEAFESAGRNETWWSSFANPKSREERGL